MFYLKHVGSGSGPKMVIENIDQIMRFSGVPYSNSRFGFMNPNGDAITSRIIDVSWSNEWSFSYNNNTNVLYINNAFLVERNYEEE